MDYATNGPSSFDSRFQAFIKWHGEIPSEAQRLAESEAHERAVEWIPGKFAGKSRPEGVVIAHQLGARWWVLVFHRRADTQTPEGAEDWFIESYSHDSSWGGDYFYWPREDRWRSCLYEFRGDHYGRHTSEARA
jgi:hypothetical protein